MITKTINCLALLISLLFLGGCGVQQLDVSSSPVQKPPLSLTDPDPIILTPYNQKVIVQNASPGQFGSVNDTFKKSNSSILYTLSPEEESKLLINNAKIQSFIISLEAELNAYKLYYETPKQNLDKNKDKNGNSKK